MGEGKAERYGNMGPEGAMRMMGSGARINGKWNGKGHQHKEDTDGRAGNEELGTLRVRLDNPACLASGRRPARSPANRDCLRAPDKAAKRHSSCTSGEQDKPIQ